MIGRLKGNGRVSRARSLPGTGTVVSKINIIFPPCGAALRAAIVTTKMEVTGKAFMNLLSRAAEVEKLWWAVRAFVY